MAMVSCPECKAEISNSAATCPICGFIFVNRVTMTDYEINKPVLFISHASSDAEFANAIKQEIEKVFENGVSVFCTSSPGAIAAGSDWLSVIEKNLDVAQAVIAIITPVSIERPWLWFEIGATWGKGRTGACKIRPLCAPEIDLSTLPDPLGRLQALSMGKAADLKLLFNELIAQFGFGKISSFRAINITSRIPKYKDVKVVEIDLNEKKFYSGKYSGYTDEELMEVIATRLFEPEAKNFMEYPSLGGYREDFIHSGKLLHFHQVDQRFDLPPGTSQRVLNKVAARYGLKPALETEHLVRYKTNGRKKI